MGGYGAELVTDYRLALAARGTSGLGTVQVNNVLTLGFPHDDQSAFRWTNLLNGAGTIEFQLPIDAAGLTPATFAPGKELHLYRNPGAGEVLVWAGHLWTVDVNAPFVRFLGIGWYETLRHRQLRSDFFRQSYEQLDTVWEMIAYTQGVTNGNIGLTRASATASGVQRTTLCCAEEAQYISDVIEELGSADQGFDFMVTPGKAWTTYFPRRGVDRSGTVTLNAGTNVTGLSYTVDGTQIENDVLAVGPVRDCHPTHMLQLLDNTSAANYGLLQSMVSRDHLGRDPDLLDSIAFERLQLRALPRQQPGVTLRTDLTAPGPLTGEFDLGDTVKLTAAWGYATFSSNFRLLGYTVDVDRIARETTTLTLDAAP